MFWSVKRDFGGEGEWREAMVGERNRDCWNCTESEQTIHFYRNKQSYSSNKINAALPDQQLVFSRVLYTQSYTNTHPFDDFVNSTTCNLFCAEIGIYPSFPFYFPTDSEFVTATSWIGLGSPSSHTTIFCLSFKPHTNLSFSSFAKFLTSDELNSLPQCEPPLHTSASAWIPPSPGTFAWVLAWRTSWFLPADF